MNKLKYIFFAGILATFSLFAQFMDPERKPSPLQQKTVSDDGLFPWIIPDHGGKDAEEILKKARDYTDEKFSKIPTNTVDVAKIMNELAALSNRISVLEQKIDGPHMFPMTIKSGDKSYDLSLTDRGDNDISVNINQIEMNKNKP